MLINITTLCHQQPLPVRDCCAGSIATSSTRSSNGWPPATSLKDRYQLLLTRLFTTDSDKKEPQARCPLQMWGGVAIAGLQQGKVMENWADRDLSREVNNSNHKAMEWNSPTQPERRGLNEKQLPEIAFGLWWGESWWWGSSVPSQLRQPAAPWVAAARLEPTWQGARSCPSTRHLLQLSVLALRASKAHLRRWGPWST